MSNLSESDSRCCVNELKYEKIYVVIAWSVNNYFEHSKKLMHHPLNGIYSHAE